MSTASRAWLADQRRDGGLGVMLAVSAVLHLIAVGVFLAAPRGFWIVLPEEPIAYTVEIVDPEALGGRLAREAIEEDRSEPEPQPVEPEEPSPEEPKAVLPEEVDDPRNLVETPVPTAAPTSTRKPKPTAKPTRKPTAKPKPKPTAKPKPPPPVSKPTVPSTRGARDREIEKAMERLRQRESRDGPDRETGRALGTGGDGGGGGRVHGLDFILYKNQVERTIKANWAWLGKNPNLTVRVGFGILPTGEIDDVRVIVRSGNGSYDASVLRAIRVSSPLPPPPEKYHEVFGAYIIDFVSGDLAAR